jgi:FMN-dependent NADH-azoreductase
MTNILYIKCSPNPKSISNIVADNLIKHLATKLNEIKIINRDISGSKIRHFDTHTLTAFKTPRDQQTDEQKEAIKLSDELISELKSADILIIATPMHNFSIPSTLRAWIDHIAKAGETFNYTHETFKYGGLLRNTRIFTVIASGDIYSEGPNKINDFAVPYLECIFKFIGLTDFTAIRAEGTARYSVEEIINKTNKEIEKIN